MKLSFLANLRPETYRQIFNQWFKAIEKRECLSVIHLPYRDQLYRVYAFLEANKSKKYHLEIIDLNTLIFDDTADLRQWFENKIKLKKRIIFLVLAADKLLEDKLFLASEFSHIYFQHPNSSFIYFFGKNITSPKLMEKLSSFSLFYQNIFIFPYLDKEDSLHFIYYLEKKLKCRFPKKLIDEIIVNCGGIPWLIEESCRYYEKEKNDKEIFTHKEIILKTNIILKEFLSEEINILEKIIKKDFNFNSDEEEIIDYFIKTRTIIKKDGVYRFHSLLLEKQFKKNLQDKLKIFLDDKNNLIVNNINVNNYFSRREKRVLIFLLKNRGEIVSRDQVGSIMWTNNPQLYSDWAVDQFIYRLRKKLLFLGFDKAFVKTIKNKGFMIQ